MFSEMKKEPELLITFITIVNKYHFISLERWAAEILLETLKARSFSATSEKLLEQVLEVAVLSRHSALTEHISAIWSTRVLSGRGTDLIALRTAKKYGVPGLEGAAYYSLLQRIGPENHSGCQPYPLDPENLLSDDERARLLSGYWSLTHLWGSIKRAPPKNRNICPESHAKSYCEARRKEIWESKVALIELGEYRPSDILKKLQVVRDETGVQGGCALAISSAVGRTIKDIEKELVYHFSDVRLRSSSTG
jgi:hypothetical protein